MRIKGYLTVEAALVFPFSLAAILMGICLFVFQYDRCLMEQDAGRLAVWAEGIEECDQEEMENRLKAGMAKLSKEKYVGWEFEDFEATMHHQQVIVKGEGNYKYKIPGWNFFHDENTWTSNVTVKRSMLSPVSFIRAYRRLGGEE